MIVVVIALSSLLAISLFTNVVVLVLNYVMANRKGYEKRDANYPASKQDTVVVAFHDNMAYWIDNQGLKTAPLTEEGEVMQSEQRQVNTNGMDQDEVNTILDVVDAIKKAE